MLSAVPMTPAGRPRMPGDVYAALDMLLQGTVRGVDYPHDRSVGWRSESRGSRAQGFAHHMPSEALEHLTATARTLFTEGEIEAGLHWQRLADEFAESVASEEPYREIDPWDLFDDDDDDTGEPTPKRGRGRPKKSDADKKLPKARTDEDIAAFLWAINRRSQTGCRFWALVKLLQHTGMRVGEALALEVTDLDFRNRTISVRNAKTKAGERDVCMPGGAYYKELEDAITKYLALRVTWEPASKLLFVKRPNAGERSDKGMDYQNVARSFRRISMRAGLDQMLTPHQLRHTYISKLLAKGAAPSGIAKQVGHADSGITLRIYSWAVNKEQQEAVRCYR